MARRFAGALLVVLMAAGSVLLCVCLAVWFFLFAGSSLPTT